MLDFGNSGTGCRLLLGAVAGCPITATFDGDASLRKRPMRRVLDPLERMGARTIDSARGRPAAARRCSGARDPMPIVYELPVPSAQVKSAVLLAGLARPGETTVIETEATRDHTERMLRHFGAEVRVEPIGAHGRRITLEGQPELTPAPIVVPADPSSAAFPLVAALIVPGSEVMIEGVMTQPAAHRAVRDAARDGRRHRDSATGATRAARRSPICACAPARLRGVEVPAERAPSMIDEYPILAVAAAFAEGTTRMRGLAGAAGQGMRPARRHRRDAARQRRRGRDRGRRPDRARRGRAPPAAALVATHLDHRIAMSALVMGLGERESRSGSTTPRFIATSFPGFVPMMRGLGADLA